MGIEDSNERPEVAHDCQRKLLTSGSYSTVDHNSPTGQRMVPIIECNLYLPSYLSPGMKQKLGSCTKRENRLLPNRITSFSQVIAHMHAPATLFHTLILCQLSNTCTNYRLLLIFLLPIVDQQQVLNSQLDRSLTPPCFLHHTVTLVPGITQELSWMNTNMTHTKITCHTVTEIIRTKSFLAFKFYGIH